MALADNLESYWPLDEASGDAIDAHGSNDLAENSGTIGSVAGKVGNARNFVFLDTENFQLADNASLSIGDVDATWAFWIYMETFQDFPTPFSKDEASNREYGLFFNAGVPTFYAGNDGTSLSQAAWGSALSTATWYFFACRHNKTTDLISFSVNAGTPVTAALSGGIFDGTAAFRLGNIGASIIFGGYLDEFGFWKRHLSDAEITELYNSGNGRDYAYITGAVSSRRRRLICGAIA
jgi:hypothetical protein